MYGRRLRSSNIKGSHATPSYPPSCPRGALFSNALVCGSESVASLSNIAGSFFPGGLVCSRRPQASHLHPPYRLRNEFPSSPLRTAREIRTPCQSLEGEWRSVWTPLQKDSGATTCNATCSFHSLLALRCLYAVIKKLCFHTDFQPLYRLPTMPRRRGDCRATTCMYALSNTGWRSVRELDGLAWRVYACVFAQDGSACAYRRRIRHPSQEEAEGCLLVQSELNCS